MTQVTHDLPNIIVDMMDNTGTYHPVSSPRKLILEFGGKHPNRIQQDTPYLRLYTCTTKSGDIVEIVHIEGTGDKQSIAYNWLHQLYTTLETLTTHICKNPISAEDDIYKWAKKYAVMVRDNYEDFQVELASYLRFKDRMKNGHGFSDTTVLEAVQTAGLYKQELHRLITQHITQETIQPLYDVFDLYACTQDKRAYFEQQYQINQMFKPLVLPESAK